MVESTTDGLAAAPLRDCTIVWCIGACMHDAVTLQRAMYRGGRASERDVESGPEGFERGVDPSIYLRRRGLALDVTGWLVYSDDELQISG